MDIFTIGFTQTTAERFFSRLKSAGVQKLVDTRLNNVSQLAGFAKKEDLAFFTKTILGVEYVHANALAPEESMLDDYKKKRIAWVEYAKRYKELLARRRVETTFAASDLATSCLLCSEATAQHCHRRLAAEYLNEQWGNVSIVHL